MRFRSKPSKEGFDAGDQRLGAKGFGDIVVCSQFETDDGVRFLGFGGQHDDGEERGIWIQPDPFADFETVHFGQHQVEDDQIGLLGFDLPEALRPGLADTVRNPSFSR